MKKTIEQLLEIDTVVGGMFRKDQTLKDTKFGYAFSRFYKKNIDPHIKEYREELQDLAVEHALEDKDTKALLVNEKGEYKYSKEGQKELTKAQRKLEKEFLSKEIEVEPYISMYTPELTETQQEILSGTLVE